MGGAIWAEWRKTWRSKTLPIAALVFVFISLICGLFMFVLKDPEQARRLGLLGTKAEVFGGSGDWPSFFNLMLVVMSAGGLIVFGFLFVWIFGREFTDRTVYDLLALPVSRPVIVVAKAVVAVCWSLVLVVWVMVLMLGIGTALELPGWTPAAALGGFAQILVTGCLTVVLCVPFALVASATRGYLPAVGAIILAVVLAQVFNTLGYSAYYPWAVPALYSGAAEVLTGGTPAPLGAVSYVLVGLVSAGSLIAAIAWWLYADQS